MTNAPGVTRGVGSSRGELTRGDVHRDFEAETKVSSLRGGPLHSDLLKWRGAG